MADTYKTIMMQEEIEARYSKHHINRKIQEEIDGNPVMVDKITEGVERLKMWAAQDFGPRVKKAARVAALMNGKDDEALARMVRSIYVGIAYAYEPVLFTNITGQMADRLGLEDKKDNIQTIGEVLAVLCTTGVFALGKPAGRMSLHVQSCIPLSQETLEHIRGAEYLPPMVCNPLFLKNNYSSGYLTHDDSLILGKGNHHDGDICLDVINLVNSVPLKLATDFLCVCEEDPNTEFTIEKAKENKLKKGEAITDEEAQVIVDKQVNQWKKFKWQSYEFYKLMAGVKEFFLTHKVDKRGRLYAQGYHISTQGTSHKKASIELAQEEIVEGVPAEFIVPA